MKLFTRQVRDIRPFYGTGNVGGIGLGTILVIVLILVLLGAL